MNALILAAGYATRLYPLTKDFPKPLLEVGAKTILDHLLDQLADIKEISAIHLVSNHKLIGHFQSWSRQMAAAASVNLIDDGTSSHEGRLGALGDLQYAIQNQNLDDDLLVCAADNILRFNLKNFVAAFRIRPSFHICVRALEDLEARCRTGIALLNADDRILEFEEKPQKPKSNWAAPPVYIYPKSILPQLKEYLDTGGKTDAPGHFVEWLVKRQPVYAYKIEGSVIDIGNLESLMAARKAQI